jgi:methionyl-tRNA formyltransferase
MPNRGANQRYAVAGNKPWNRRVFDEVISKYPGEWYFLQAVPEVTLAHLQQIKPKFVFFLHWSHKVPAEVLAAYECVCFHMTDVPYGRGGSPLQNLIVRGHSHTRLTALRMVEDFDAGPVYYKEDLCLQGNAEEIYLRATYLAASMIARIIAEKPQPVPQTGEPTIFHRRQPQESEIPALESLQQLHDFLRMLDAAGYPRAFLQYQGFRYEFTRAALYDGRIVADVTITPVAPEQV